MSERLTILNARKRQKNRSKESIEKEVNFTKFIIGLSSVLAIICFGFIIYELVTIYILSLKTKPSEGIWLMFLLLIQSIMMPSSLMEQQILNHELDLIQNGDSRKSTSLNQELKEIMSAKKGILGVIILIPLVVIFCMSSLFESSRIFFEPYFLFIFFLVIAALILIYVDYKKYISSFKKNVEIYSSLT